MMTPTVGRIVHYHPSAEDLRQIAGAPLRPLAALVTFVHERGITHAGPTLNLTVFDANGVPWARTGVPLLELDEAQPAAGAFCTWPPREPRGESVAIPRGDG